MPVASNEKGLPFSGESFLKTRIQGALLPLEVSPNRLGTEGGQLARRGGGCRLGSCRWRRHRRLWRGCRGRRRSWRRPRGGSRLGGGMDGRCRHHHERHGGADDQSGREGEELVLIHGWLGFGVYFQTKREAWRVRKIQRSVPVLRVWVVIFFGGGGVFIDERGS